MTIPNWSADAVAAVAPILDKWISYYGLPRDIVYGQVALESAFNPNATGAVGEIGLLQIKPSTAQGVGFTGNDDELYDPDTNVRYGLAYLRAQLDRYGDIDSALSAYNAGHPITGNRTTYVQPVHDRAAYFASIWPTSSSVPVLGVLLVVAVIVVLAVAFVDFTDH